MITEGEINKLIGANIITVDQGQQIVAFQQNDSTVPASLQYSSPHKPSFSFANTLYYLGGFLIVFAISYFLGSNWELLGNFGRISSTFVLIVLFGGIGMYLKKTPYKVAGSLLLLAATIVIPLLVHSVERALGWWPPINTQSGQLTYDNFLSEINTAWIILDTVTVVASFYIFTTFKDPILSLPVAHFFWFLVLDGTSFITGAGSNNVGLKSWISIIAGVLLVKWGTYYYARKDNRVGVWPWIYGLAIIFGALITLRLDNSGGFNIVYQFLILVAGIATFFAATPLRSKTFLTFGTFGIFWFIQDISWTYFRDSLGFSVVLIISGLLTIGFGILVQKYYKKQFATK